MEKNYYPIEFDENGSSFVIINNGTAPTPCCITIIPKIDIMNLVIEGLSREPIKVSNVKTKDVLLPCMGYQQRQCLQEYHVLPLILHR